MINTVPHVLILFVLFLTVFIHFLNFDHSRYLNLISSLPCIKIADLSLELSGLITEENYSLLYLFIITFKLNSWLISRE